MALSILSNGTQTNTSVILEDVVATANTGVCHVEHYRCLCFVTVSVPYVLLCKI